MTEDSPNDLNFGHFGQPAYDLENNQWVFSRTSHGAPFKQLGEWDFAVPAERHFQIPSVPRPLRHSRATTSAIAVDFPDLAPAVKHVPRLEAISVAATAASTIYDASVGQLLSVGAINPGTHSNQIRYIAAMPCGEGGNILRLQLLVKQRQGWDQLDHRGSYIEGLSIKGDVGYWNEDAAPIRQVCFAQSENNNNFLAVRFPERIALFHPRLYGRRRAAVKSCFYDLPPSIVHARPFHSISIEDTGGIPHADVVFNHHYQRQFAIVDQECNWSIWDIDGNRRGYSIKQTAAQRMRLSDDLESKEQENIIRSWKEDGWARMLWVRDANTILICNRRQLELVDLREPSRPLKMSQVIDWSNTNNPSKHWILDAKKHPKNEKQFFVLTSKRLFLFAIPFMGDEPKANPSDADAVVIMSWIHFRDTEDITLQIYVKATSEEENTISIYSRLNDLITIYRITDQTLLAAPYCSYGPTTLQLSYHEATKKTKRIINFGIEKLHFKTLNDQGSAAGQQYIDDGVQFFQFSAIFDDLSVAQTLLFSRDLGASKTSTMDILPPLWSSVIQYRRSHAREKISSDDDGFIEPDGLIHDRTPRLVTVYSLPKMLVPETTEGLQDSFDFTNVYLSLMSSIRSLDGFDNLDSRMMDMQDMGDEVEKLLDNQSAPCPLGTLGEVAGLRPTVDDIDEVSLRWQELLNHRSLTTSMRLREIAHGHILALKKDGSESSPSLSFVYDTLLQTWVAPLPGRISARLRQGKERIARRVAAELILASTRVRAPDTREATFIPEQAGSSLLSSAMHDIQPHSFQPSDVSNVSPPSGEASTAVDPLSRLGKHLLLEGPPTLTISSNISQVLAHWELGTDPSQYNWEATERAMEEEFEMSQDEEARARREKARRKRERQAKRQKRQDELFAGGAPENIAVESQPQPFRSSPGPMHPTSSQIPASSQHQPFGGLLVQSQAEPGQHGGRPVKKKKKMKSRMSGF